MGDALAQAKLSGTLFKRAGSERHGGEALVDIVEEDSGSLHLEAVLAIDMSLEHGGTEFGGSGLSFTTGECNINRIDFIILEGAGFHTLLIVGAQQNILLAVNDISLHFVHNGASDGTNIVGLSNLQIEQKFITLLPQTHRCSPTYSLHSIGYFCVGVAGSDQTSGNFSSSPGGMDNISTGPCHRSLGSGLSNNHGVCANGNVAVNVDTHVDLDGITINQRRQLQKQPHNKLLIYRHEQKASTIQTVSKHVLSALTEHHGTLAFTVSSIIRTEDLHTVARARSCPQNSECEGTLRTIPTSGDCH
jgi:hypothetical protein